MTSPRYAIYYTPAETDPLHIRAAKWLGRDAFVCKALDQSPLNGFDADEIDRMTKGPRHYGFHATMKAPFELAEGKTQADLLSHLERFASGQGAFRVEISPQSLGEFLAFRLNHPSHDMTKLHTACVTQFDSFRAPLSEADIARRRRAKLSPEQDARMLEWGYPFIFDDFRWHMTLSNRIKSDMTRSKALEGLKALFYDTYQEPHLVDGIAVFFQRDRDAPFHVLKRAQFAK